MGKRSFCFLLIFTVHINVVCVSTCLTTPRTKVDPSPTRKPCETPLTSNTCEPFTAAPHTRPAGETGWSAAACSSWPAPRRYRPFLLSKAGATVLAPTCLGGWPSCSNTSPPIALATPFRCAPPTHTRGLTGAPAPRDAVGSPALQDDGASNDPRQARQQAQATDYSLRCLGHLDRLLGL